MRRFSTSSSTSTNQRQMFPPSLPAPPYPAPDLSPVKNKSRRTSAPAVSHRSYEVVDSCNNNRNSQRINIEIMDMNKYHVKADEKIMNDLSPKYLLHSPPQSLVAESVSHSEFDSLLIANEGFSIENDFINKIKNNSVSKSNLSQYSEESLLTTLVQCQYQTENYMNHKFKRKINLTSHDTCFKSLKPTSSNIFNPIKLPDQPCLNQRLMNDYDNFNKINILNNDSTIAFNDISGIKTTKTYHRFIISNKQNPKSTNHTPLDKMNINHRNIDLKTINKVELAKRYWENYFKPKPPRITKNKIIENNLMTKSTTININNKLTDLCLQSTNNDYNYQNYNIKNCIDNKYDFVNNQRQYKHNDNEYVQISQFGILSTCTSSNSSTTNSIINQSEFFPLTNNNNNNNKTKYIGKGYSPSFIRLINDYEFNNIEKNQQQNSYELIQLLYKENQLHNHYSSNSTLNHIETTETFEKHNNTTNNTTNNNTNNNSTNGNNGNSTNSNNNNSNNSNNNNNNNRDLNDSAKEIIINKKYLYQNNIEFPNYNNHEYLDYYNNFLHPQSVTLRRHCIYLDNNNNDNSNNNSNNHSNSNNNNDSNNNSNNISNNNNSNSNNNNDSNNNSNNISDNNNSNSNNNNDSNNNSNNISDNNNSNSNNDNSNNNSNNNGNNNDNVNIPSSIPLNNLQGTNENNKNTKIIRTQNNPPYTYINNRIQTHHNLNNKSDWSKCSNKKQDTFHKHINKTFKQNNKKNNNNTTLIDHLIIPIHRRYSTIYPSIYSIDYNLLKSNLRNHSITPPTTTTTPTPPPTTTNYIDRIELFDKTIKHISSNVKLNKKTEYPNDKLKHILFSSYSSISTSSLISSISVDRKHFVHNNNNNSFELFNHKEQFLSLQDYCQRKISFINDKIKHKQETSPLQLSGVNELSLSPRIYYDNYIEDDNDNDVDDKENDTNSHNDDYENEKVKHKLKMSLSPAAQRYEEHVLATVSSRPYNKTGNQIFFNDHKNYVTHQNLIKKVHILPECQYDKKPIEIIKDYNYDEEENDSTNQQNEDLFNAELWREKFGAITRWRREVDDAMLAGETERFHSPETILHDNCVKEEFSRSPIPNQHNVTNYLKPTIVQANPFQSNGLYSSINNVETNYSTSSPFPNVQSYTNSKPLVSGKEAIGTKQHILCSPNNLKSNTYQIPMTKNMNVYDNVVPKCYQPTNHTVPSKVVINPSGVANDQTYQYDNNIRPEDSQQINSKYQAIRIKAPIPKLQCSRQRSNSGNAGVLQPGQQIENFTNIPNHYYYPSSNPVNLTPNIQGSIHHSYEPNIPLSNMNSSMNKYKNSTIKSFRNFLTPKLRRKTYELDRTESVRSKQDDHKLMNNSVEQHLDNNNSRSINERNNPLKKVVSSTSYTDALNLAVAANTALNEAFNQSITSTDSCQKTNSTTPISFKQQKFKTTTSPINPGSSIITNERSPAEVNLTPIDVVKIENKTNTCKWTKISKPYKNISLSPISSISQYNNGDKNSSVDNPMDKNKFKIDTTEQTLYSDNKCRSPKLLISEKSDDFTETNTDTKRIHGRVKSSLRHSVTLSPCRRKPDVTLEQCNSPYLQPSPLALSSGFVSAGSIVNTVEECNEKMNKDGFVETSSKVKSVPPPVGVHDYPIVTNLEKDLNKIDSLINDSLNIHLTDTTTSQRKSNPSELSNNSIQKSNEQQQQSKPNKSLPLQTLPPCKLLLGRVASNEDICIETETPFSFNIAATDKEICITRVASVEDLKCQQNHQHDPLKGNNNPNNNKSIKRNYKRIPISLRLTFGSESKLNQSIVHSNENYRAMYYVDIPQCSRTTELRRKTNPLKNYNTIDNHNTQNIIRYSLPCITYCEELPKPISLLPPLSIEKNR